MASSTSRPAPSGRRWARSSTSCPTTAAWSATWWTSSTACAAASWRSCGRWRRAAACADPAAGSLPRGSGARGGRQHVADQQDVQVDQHELVPGRRGVQRLARIGELGLEDSRQRRLGEAHGTDHELGGNLAAGALAAVAVGERHAEDIVGGALARRDLRRLAKPPGEAVLPPLDALAVGRAVLFHEESG